MHHGRSLALALSSLAVLVTLTPARGQGLSQKPPTPVTWSAEARPAAPAKPGSTLQVSVTARVEKGWHIYGVEELPNGPRPLRIALAPDQPFTGGKLEAPEPSRERDDAFDQIITFYAATTTFQLPVAVSAQVPPGSHTLALDIAYQACDGRICLPRRQVKLSVPVEIAGR